VLSIRNPTFFWPELPKIRHCGRPGLGKGSQEPDVTCTDIYNHRRNTTPSWSSATVSRSRTARRIIDSSKVTADQRTPFLQPLRRSWQPSQPPHFPCFWPRSRQNGRRPCCQGGQRHHCPNTQGRCPIRTDCKGSREPDIHWRKEPQGGQQADRRTRWRLQN
jgi:hypothetical protein